MRAVPRFDNFEGYFDFKGVNAIAKDVVREALLPSTGDRTEPIQFVHHSSGQRLPVARLRKHIQDVHGVECQELAVDEWIECATTAGIDPLTCGNGDILAPHLHAAPKFLRRSSFQTPWLSSVIGDSCWLRAFFYYVHWQHSQYGANPALPKQNHRAITDLATDLATHVATAVLGPAPLLFLNSLRPMDRERPYSRINLLRRHALRTHLNQASSHDHGLRGLPHMQVTLLKLKLNNSLINNTYN
jgi:hypothetical protein